MSISKSCVNHSSPMSVFWRRAQNTDTTGSDNILKNSSSTGMLEIREESIQMTL
jgi:hypothetical protein